MWYCLNSLALVLFYIPSTSASQMQPLRLRGVFLSASFKEGEEASERFSGSSSNQAAPVLVRKTYHANCFEIVSEKIFVIMSFKKRKN